MTRVFLSLGSNEGDRLNMLCQAAQMLGGSFNLLALSRVYETKPWGVTEQPNFLNMCVAVDAECGAFEVLERINEIEALLGRLRKTRWGQRTIDIDIIFFGNSIIESDRLTVPHKYMQQRAFVLVPLCDIAADFMHPLLNKTTAELLAELPKEDMKCLGYLPL